MNKTQAIKIVGGLSKPGKMPCKALSLPTAACKTGALMAKAAGSICSMCYANKGNYIKYAATITPAQYRRLEALKRSDWVEAMVTAIGTDRFFRWHDSGDIQDVAHLENIVRVAELTPACKHWLPTREYGIVRAFLAQGGRVPDNLVIRLSAMFPDVPVDTPRSLCNVPGVLSSNVHMTRAAVGHECPAPKQGNSCGQCRACWDRTVPAVSYHAH